MSVVSIRSQAAVTIAQSDTVIIWKIRLFYLRLRQFALREIQCCDIGHQQHQTGSRSLSTRTKTGCTCVL